MIDLTPNPRRFLLAVYLVMLLLLLAPCGCREPQRAHVLARDAPKTWESEACVLLISPLRGRVRPCGCSTPQLGGVQRIAAVVDSLETRLDCEVVAVGQRSAPESLTSSTVVDRYVSRFVDGLDASTLEAQDTRRSTSRPVAEFLGRRFLIGSERVHILYVEPTNTESSAPQEARSQERLGDVAAAVEASVGVPLVVAVEGSVDVLQPIARLLRVGDVLIAIGDIGGKPLVELIGPSRAALVGMRDRGRDLVLLCFDRSSESLCVEVLGVGAELDALGGRRTSHVQSLLTSLRQEIHEGDFLERMPRVEEPGPNFAGSASCGACHRMQESHWQSSRHSHALTTLQAVGSHRDPACVVCHTTGWDRPFGDWRGHPSGWAGADAPDGLQSVGCEACHGPGGDHVSAPTTHRLVASPGQRVCVRCHDADNSPRFIPEFRSHYLPRATHAADSRAE